TARFWTDSNGNQRPDCNLANSAANGECGAWLSPSFGQPDPVKTWDPNFLNGWGVRPFSWQGAVTLQQELHPGVALNVGYFRTWYGNFVLGGGFGSPSLNRALAPNEFAPFCVNAPVDARLGSVSGTQVCGFYDPTKVVKPDYFVTPASTLGKQTQVY